MSSLTLAEVLGEEEEDHKTILNVLIENMKRYGKFNLTGEQKKKLLLDTLKYELDLEPIVENLIIELVDILIDVENKKIVFNPKIKKSFSLLGWCLGQRGH